MQGLGCFAIIVYGFLWYMTALFLGLGMPLIGILTGLLIWKVHRGYGGLVVLISAVSLAVAIPVYWSENRFANAQAVVFLTWAQGVITALLLAYTLYAERDAQGPQDDVAYITAQAGGWLGLACNVIVFGVPAMFHWIAG